MRKIHITDLHCGGKKRPKSLRSKSQWAGATENSRETYNLQKHIFSYKEKHAHFWLYKTSFHNYDHFSSKNSPMIGLDKEKKPFYLVSPESFFKSDRHENASLFCSALGNHKDKTINQSLKKEGTDWMNVEWNCLKVLLELKKFVFMPDPFLFVTWNRRFKEIDLAFVFLIHTLCNHYITQGSKK